MSPKGIFPQPSLLSRGLHCPLIKGRAVKDHFKATPGKSICQIASVFHRLVADSKYKRSSTSAMTAQEDFASCNSLRCSLLYCSNPSIFDSVLAEILNTSAMADTNATRNGNGRLNNRFVPEGHERRVNAVHFSVRGANKLTEMS